MPKYVTDDNPLEPKSEMLKIVNLEYIEKNYPHERQSIVDGLIRTGSVMNIIAAPKVGKSFIASNLAMCLITGSDFLGFPIARQGKTLVVDNELHLETLSYRYRATRTAMNVPEDQRHMIDILSLRGIPCDIPMLQKHVGGTRPGHYSAIILDAFYKLIPSGISENDNTAMGGIYTQLERLATEMDCAVVVIHHSSKGFQGDKSLSDVGAGAGTISRSVDAHMVIRPHETPGYCVCEALVRSWKQPEPRTIQFNFPVWRVVTDEKPIVQQPKSPGAEKRAAEERETDRVVKDTLTSGDLTEKQISDITGISRPKVKAALLRIGAIITETGQTQRGTGWAKYSNPPEFTNGSDWTG
jgi:hypothetical protein